MNKIDKKILIMFTFLFLGLAMSMQFKGINKSLEEKSKEKSKYDYYVELLKQEQKTGDSLKKLVSNNIDKKERFLMNSTDITGKNTYLKLKWSKAKFLAGLTDVQGPGIVITLNDSLVANQNPLQSIIHDSDILRILNELKIAGAQALSINDERILSTSEIICTGPTIRVNKTRYTVPFQIKAIGDSDKLLSSLNGSNIISYMKTFNIRINIQQSQELAILKYSGNIEKKVNSLEEIK